MNTAAGNKHLQFTAEIWTKEENFPIPAKEERVQIVTNDELPSLDIKMSWSSEGDMLFGVFRKKGQQLNYVGKDSAHTPGTLPEIPSGFLNRFTKLTSRNPSIHYESVDKYYPDHANALHKVGLTLPNLPTMG